MDAKAGHHLNIAEQDLIPIPNRVGMHLSSSNHELTELLSECISGPYSSNIGCIQIGLRMRNNHLLNDNELTRMAAFRH